VRQISPQQKHLPHRTTHKPHPHTLLLLLLLLALTCSS
jgi:hypothetical protein